MHLHSGAFYTILMDVDYQLLPKIYVFHLSCMSPPTGATGKGASVHVKKNARIYIRPFTQILTPEKCRSLPLKASLLEH